ncbi:MAG: hypothetical protein WA414_01475 [Acidobacteriaceae bacterium]
MQFTLHFGDRAMNVPVLNVRRTWEDHVLRSKVTSVNEALLAEIPDAIVPEDEPVDRAVAALFDRLSLDASKPAKKKRRSIAEFRPRPLPEPTAASELNSATFSAFCGEDF